MTERLLNPENNPVPTRKGKDSSSSPNPSEVPLHLEVFSLLQGGIDSLPLNDYGRPWPYPRRSALLAICERYPADLCRKAAQEAREIVQSQDRAPNITGLFKHRLAALAEVRDEIRDSLEAA